MKLSGAAVVICFAVLVIAFVNRNDLPASIDYVDAILDEPLQTETGKQPFDVTYRDNAYHIEPEFEYDLTGMVVSFRHHDGKSRMHSRANDHLNMLDVCVVWGDNTANPRLDRIDFWNGIFTCQFRTRDSKAWDAFDIYQISNNHLLSDRPRIRDAVHDIRIGDQIRVRGYLATYSNDEGSRGTSTTRLDTGNGACETIYVERFEILRPATSYWRIAMWLALGGLLASLYVYFRQPYRPYADEND